MILGLVSKERYEQALLAHKETIEKLEQWQHTAEKLEKLVAKLENELEEKTQELVDTVARTVTMLERSTTLEGELGKRTQELTNMQARAEAAERACQVAEETCARVTMAHATRVRVGHIGVDPIGLTARLRAIEGSLRCEWDGDKIVVYADHPLPEAQINAVVAAMTPQLNRT